MLEVCSVRSKRECTLKGIEVMAASIVYDVAVIGAGVIGSAAASQIVKAGATVILLDQFGAGHTRGSSHGGSRITRHLYDKEYYTRMMIEAFPMWEQIEKESGVTLYKQTGMAHFYPKGSEKLERMVTNMHSCNLPVSLVDAKQAKDLCPYLNVPDNFIAAVEEEAGILAGSKAVAALQDVFIKNGGEFHDCHSVTGIVPGDVVIVKSNKGDIKAKKIVITVGPWAKKFMALLGVDLPLRTVRNESLYWEADELPNNARSNFKIVIISDGSPDTDGSFIIPEYEYPGLIKVHYRSYHGVEVDPDSRDANTNQNGIEATKRFIFKYLTGISTTPSVVEPCIVTKTPDNDFIIDKHPEHSNIIIGVGFTGHGYKLAPVIGKILTEMTMELPLSYDISPFSLNRLKS